MIDQLKQLFPSLLTNQQISPDQSTDYKWFTTPNNEVIGIKDTELVNKDQALLSLFLTPYHGAHPPVTAKEHAWYKLLFEKGLNQLTERPEFYRLVYFSLSKPLADPLAFREAITGLYPEQPIIIWIDQQTGIIIEQEVFNDEESISYLDMVEVFTSDFFLDLRFFIGPYLTDLTDAKAYFQWMKATFKRLEPFNIKRVITYVNAVPYLLPTLTAQTDQHFLVRLILKDTLGDEELLRTIQIFLECNSNISLAAKEMYMHRNSLQYRIDKFIEKTQIDVKQFEGALAVYLILLLKKQLERIQ
ncbi:PucR family transcriptional regulator [Amphibacillus sediminis]|uniref:PucR family transcriptional regulator n=1 Tax=Amphibacillus sediminis TaxID=360185 RepID=UPI0008363D9F|nr:helix-turn-helix domain-containing protein [Amphibacillus sediminis]